MKLVKFTFALWCVLSSMAVASQEQVINLLVDCTHDYSFNISNASRTQGIFKGINCLTSCKTIHKLELSQINALVVLMDGKMPYHERDVPYLLDYVKKGGGLYIGAKTGGVYADSMTDFLSGFGLKQVDAKKSGAGDKPRGIYPDSRLPGWPEIAGRRNNLLVVEPLRPKEWVTVYATDAGDPVVMARKYGKGIILSDTAAIYRKAISEKDPYVEIARKLIEYMSRRKTVEPLKGGGGWQFSDGYRWELITTTRDGLRVHHNEYSKMYVKNDVKAYQETVKYLTQLTGLNEKHKAVQIKELNERKAELKSGARIDVDVSGVKRLTLMSTDGGNGIGTDHSIFADNWLIDRNGKKVKLELTNALEVKPGYGRAYQDTLDGERKLSVGGVEFDNGIFLHANGTMTYEIDGKYKRFTSLAGCYTKSHGSVGFKVLGDGRELWNDGKVYTGGVPGGDPNNVNYVPEGILFQLKYLPCVGSGFLLPQGSAVDVPPKLKDDWQVHLGMLAHEMGHAWSFPFCERIGEESSAFIFNNLVLHHHYGQKHGDSVTRRLINYLKKTELDDVDLAQKADNFKYYMFIDLMIREYGEGIWRNYNLLKYALLNKEGARWDAHSTAWLWSIATGRDVFPLFAAGFGSHMDKTKVQLPEKAMKAGFDPVAVGRLYKVPLKKLKQERDIFSSLKSFADVRAFYAKEVAEKGHPAKEG